MKYFHLRTFAIAFLALSLPIVAAAHDGPPFPIVVDQHVGPCIVSVWTDPDIGQGTFFIITQPAPNSSLPGDLRVQVSVQPASGRLPEATYSAVRDNTSGQMQYKALVNFDVQEQWRVRVRLDSSQGSGETVAFVEPTPVGLGRWDLLIYFVPFLLVGFLWLRAFVATKKHKKHKRHKTYNEAS